MELKKQQSKHIHFKNKHTMSEFKKLQINTLTHKDQLNVNKTVAAYEKVCELMTSIKIDIEAIICEKSEISKELFFEFLKAKNPATWIKEHFVILKEISFPGIKPQALIESDLLDLPEVEFKRLIDERSKLTIALNLADKLYPCELDRFWMLEGEFGCFVVPDGFKDEVAESFIFYTSNQDENVLIEAMQEYINSVNKLIKLGVLHKDARWAYEVSFDTRTIDFDNHSDTPLSLNKEVLSRIHVGMRKKRDNPDVKMSKDTKNAALNDR